MMEALLRKIIEEYPENTQAILKLADLKMSMGKMSDAEVLYKKVLRKDVVQDARVEAMIGLAQVYRRMKAEPAKILSYVQEAYQYRPEDARVIELLKGVYRELGQWQDLLQLIERLYNEAGNTKDKSMLALEAARVALDGLKDEGLFLKWIRIAYDQMPNNPEVVQALVKYYKEKNDIKELMPYLQWLWKYAKANKDRELLVQTGKDFGEILERTDPQKALSYYETILKIEPKDVQLRSKMGELYVKLNKWQEAIDILQPLILKIDRFSKEDRRNILFNLALAYKGIGDKHKMRQYLLRILSENPDDDRAEELLID